MSNILIAGGKGFIGSNLTAALVRLGHSVTIFDHPHSSSPLPEGTRRKIRWIDDDFTRPRHLDAAFLGQEIVFHLISTTIPKSSNDDPISDFTTNVVGSIRMLEAAARNNVRKFIFLSSGGTVYGIPREIPIPETHPTDPISAYGVTKLTIEKYLALFRSEHGLDYTILRVANPFGPYQRTRNSQQGAVGVFLERALQGQQIEIWGDGEIVRDYVHISDVVNAMTAAMPYQGDARLFNVGSGEGRSLNEVVRAIEDEIGRKIQVRYMQSRRLDVPSNVLDIRKIRAAIGWQPNVSFKDGIRMTISDMKEALRA